jgi:hypothetical protein
MTCRTPIRTGWHARSSSGSRGTNFRQEAGASEECGTPEVISHTQAQLCRRRSFPACLLEAPSFQSAKSRRWDRNRICNLWFWSTRHTIQRHPRLSNRYVVSFVVNAPDTPMESVSLHLLEMPSKVQAYPLTESKFELRTFGWGKGIYIEPCSKELAL